MNEAKARINWAATPADAALVGKIADRAELLYAKHSMKFDRKAQVMDLIACHLNGCPLRLQSLLEARDFDFAHDIGGITRHLDRKTGQLGDCFMPRYADTAALARAAG